MRAALNLKRKRLDQHAHAHVLILYDDTTRAPTHVGCVELETQTL
jgi:hypothetical protein